MLLRSRKWNLRPSGVGLRFPPINSHTLAQRIYQSVDSSRVESSLFVETFEIRVPREEKKNILRPVESSVNSREMKLASFLLVITYGITFCNVDAFDLNRFFWPGYQQQKEEIRVIEIVRWHQPICVKPGKGVSSCMHGPRTTQQHPNGKGLNEEKGGQEFSILSERSSGESSKEEEVLSEFVGSYPLHSSLDSDISTEGIGSESGKRTEALLTTERGRRTREARRHLIPHLDKTSNLNRPKQIYVTKVLNAPFTATLVAQNCLPDFGIPLCENNNEKEVEGSKSTADFKPSLSISVIGEDEEMVSSVEFPRNSFPVIKSVEQRTNEERKADVESTDSDQGSSTSFILDYPSTTHVPASQRVEESGIPPSNLSEKRRIGDDRLVSSETELILESSKGAKGMVDDRESSVATKSIE